MKKKILFVYPEMMIGGSTTNLISLLNGLNRDQYDISLQLLRNKGPLMEAIPAHITLLPAAEKYSGLPGKLVMKAQFFLSGYCYKARRANQSCGKKGFSRQIIMDFKAARCSRRSVEIYDYALGGLEGWADRYVAYSVQAAVKYGWLHSVIDKIAEVPELELNWMNQMDKVISVSENCRSRLNETLPSVKCKSVYYDNVMDTALVRRRAGLVDNDDPAFARFQRTERFKIISVCRLCMETKGLDRMVSCAARLKANGYRFLWYVIGDGEDREAVEKMVFDFGVGDCIAFIGQRTNPYPFIKASDILCMPSRWEGKPVTVTESKMLGTPPVVTAYLSANEQIKEPVEGLVAPNTDTAIYDKIVACIENPMLLASMRSYLLTHEYGNEQSIKLMEQQLFAEIAKDMGKEA